MRRYAAALLVLLLPAWAGGEVKLDVDGKTQTVQVERQVTVKDSVLVVMDLPFTIKAPPGAGLYFWNVPATLTATEKADSLEVTAAPNGKTTISVKSIGAKLDKDGKFIGFVTEFGSITFYVKEVGPGPKPPDPPGPVPGPLGPLAAQLKSSLDQDIAESTGTKANAGTLAQVYRQGAPLTASDTFRNIGDLYQALTKVRATLLPNPQTLIRLRTALAKHLDAKLPTNIDTPLDAPTRAKAKAAFEEIATALEELSK